MVYGDACVIPFPKGNTTIRRFAYELGVRGITCALAEGISSPEIFSFPENNTVILFPITLIKGTDKEILNALRDKKNQKTHFLVPVNDNRFTRTVLSQPAVFGVYNYHMATRDAFDRVCAKMAAERGIAVDISIRPIVSCRGWERQKIIRRYEELIRLWHRYRFPVLISTHAQTVTDIRSPQALIRLCSLFGLEKGETKEIISSIPDLINPPGLVREIL